MSLKQKEKKIKCFISLLIIGQILIIGLLYSWVFRAHNRGDNLVFIPNHFETSFNQQSDSQNQKKGADTGSDFHIVASVNGIRYYYSHCAGVGRINLENRVYFDSEEAAERAGYTIANNCSK